MITTRVIYIKAKSIQHGDFVVSGFILGLGQLDRYLRQFLMLKDALEMYIAF